MTASMLEPVTRAELREEMSALRDEMSTLRDEMRACFAQQRTELYADLASLVNGMGEQLWDRIRVVVDEQYNHLPGVVRTLRHDLDAHRDDRTLHVQPRVSSPKRATKRATRKSR